MNDKRERKVLEDDYLGDNNQMSSNGNNYNNNYIDEDENKDEGFKFSKLAFAFSLISAIILIFFAFTKNILPVNKRILYTAGLVVLEGIFYFIVTRKDKKFLKFIASILMIGITLFTFAFLYYFLKLDNSIKIMNENKISEDDNKQNIETILESNVGESFNVYISGVDVYGDLSRDSRSDVNIIATVNLATGKVLLTTVPRDTYLPIAGDGNNENDKLTHAGNYGVQSSIDTLENFLDIDITYYARVNFDSLVNLVDVIGGVEIENDQAFKSSLSGRYYEQGKVQLDGKAALDFVRERYTLKGGDNQRGRNQEKVLEAMIRKTLTPSLLLNFDGIMNTLNKSMVTNMSTNKIMDIVNMQIFSNKSFEIDSQEVKGEGTMDLPSYAMPDHQLYMFVPFEESVQEVKDTINQTLKIDYTKRWFIHLFFVWKKYWVSKIYEKSTF